MWSPHWFEQVRIDVVVVAYLLEYLGNHLDLQIGALKLPVDYSQETGYYIDEQALGWLLEEVGHGELFVDLEVGHLLQHSYYVGC